MFTKLRLNDDVGRRELNELLTFCKNNFVMVKGEYERCSNRSLTTHCFYQDKETVFILTTGAYFNKEGKIREGKPTTYKFHKDGYAHSLHTNGAEAYNTMIKNTPKEYRHNYDLEKCDKVYNAVNLPRVVGQEYKYEYSASPIIGYNPKYNNQQIDNAYEYDINSAYGAACLKDLPYFDFGVEKNVASIDDYHIGFNVVPDKIGRQILRLAKHGGSADYAFLKQESYMKDFVKKYYAVKKTKTGKDKTKAKATLNLPIGYLQRKNPFLRAFIVETCNNLIRKIREIYGDDIIAWNTDAVVSRVPLPLLKIGDDIGQFKMVELEWYRMKGNNYQYLEKGKTKSVTSYRSKSKRYFDKHPDWNILTDEPPKNADAMAYRFNEKTKQIVRCRND